MRTNKIIALFVYLLCLCLTLSSCMDHRAELDLYSIYVVGESESSNHEADYGDIVYNAADKICVISDAKETVKKGMEALPFRIGSETVVLEYHHTLKKLYCEYDVNVYSDIRRGIDVAFRIDTGCLEWLAVGNCKYRICEGRIDSEAKLMETCANYLSQYVDDLDSYNSRIRTKVQTIDDHGLDNQFIDGYVSSLAHPNSTVSYEVFFSYHIGGIATSDSINISIDSEGYLYYWSFNMTDAFRDFADIEVDIARCNELISSEMSKLCSVEKYQYIGYSDSKRLIILENKLCLLSKAKPIYEVSNDMDINVREIQLIIPISGK